MLDHCRYNPQAWPSKSFVDHTIDLLCQNFPESTEFGAKFQWMYPYFWRYSNFLITQFRIGQRKLLCQNRAPVASELLGQGGTLYQDLYPL